MKAALVRARLVMSVGLLLSLSCAVAPINFYQSGFAPEKSWQIDLSAEGGRSYDEIVNDTSSKLSASDYTAWMSTGGFWYSPVNRMSFGLQMESALLGALGGSLRAKGVLFQTENAAAALLLRAGASSAEADVWDEHYSYDTQTLTAGSVLSFGNPKLNLGFGPKLVVGHLNINSDSSGSFRGNVFDYGGFLNGVAVWRCVKLSGEATLLYIDRPLAGSGALIPYVGAQAAVIF